MSKVDNRVVNMKFNNAQFEKGTEDTIKSLGQLKKALDLDGVGDNVSGIAAKFSAFGAIAFSALQRLTNAAIDFGTQIAGAILDPLIEGGKKRALNIEQAKFQFKGLGMDVEQSMADALFAVQGTAFGLDEAAVAAAQFGASGIQSGADMQNALRGISGVAAMAGSSYTDMANVFTKVAGQGRLMGDDLNRLGARGINAAATLGKAFGKTESEIREMVTKGEISFQMFAEAMSNAFGEHATKANETYTGSLANMRAALARIGASFATADFERQRVIFNALAPAIDKIAVALKPVIDLFTELSAASGEKTAAFINGLDFTDLTNGVSIAVEGIRNLLDLFGHIGKIAKLAWNSIFPSSGGPLTIITDIATAFKNFTETLKIGGAESDRLRSTFAGFFAILDIGWMIIKGVFDVIGRLFGILPNGTGGFLAITAAIGDFIVGIRDFLKSGKGLEGFFKGLGDVLAWPIEAVKKLWEILTDSGPINFFKDVWQNFLDLFKPPSGGGGEGGNDIFKWIADGIGNAIEAVTNFIKNFDPAVLVGLLNAGVLAGVGGIIAALVGAIKKGITIGFDGSLVDTIKDAFGAVTDTLGLMQMKLKADVLIKIGIAIGILAASILVLSFIDTGKLFIALGAITIMAGQLMAAMVIMQKVTSDKGFMKMPVLASTLILLAGAMVIFAAAMAIMATLDWNEVASGLVAMAGGLTLMLGALRLSASMGPKIVFTAGAFGILAGALVIFAAAMKIFASLSWDDIGRSLTALVGTLGLVVVSMRIVQSASGGAAAMFLVSAALTVLGAALLVMAKMEWDEILRALATLAGSLTVLTLAVSLMSANKGVLLGAAAMIVIAAALNILAPVLKKFTEFSWEDFGKLMAVLGGSLAILAGAMALMGIPLVALGAVALTAVSFGLMMLAPALAILANLSWDDIGRGLTMLGASLAILAVGGLLMIPASVGFLLLGVAILAIGGGVLMAAQGMMLFAVAITTLAGAAALGAEGIKMALITLAGAIPEIMKKFAEGIIEFAVTIAEGGAEFTAAASTLITAIVTAINDNSPLVIDTLWNMLMQMVAKLEENVPILVEKGGNLIIGVLNGMESKVPGIARAGTNLMITLMRAISNEVPRLAQEGMKAIIRLVNGISTAIDQNSAAMGAAGGRLAASIVRGMVNGIFAGIGEIVSAAQEMAASALNAAKNFLGINSPSKEFHEIGGFSGEGLAEGLIATAGMVSRAGTYVGKTALDSTKKSLAKISSAVATDINMSPTIRPVLDLSAIKKDSGLIGNMLTPPSLKLDGSVAYVSQAQQVAEMAELLKPEFVAPDMGQNTINFYQTNNSPKPISQWEVYRRTKNQLSEAKKELTTSDA